MLMHYPLFLATHLHYPLAVSCPYRTPATYTIRRPDGPVEARLEEAATEWKDRLNAAELAAGKWPAGEAARALEADPLYNTARSDAGRRRTVSCIIVHYSLLGMHYSTCFIPHSIFGVSRG